MVRTSGSVRAISSTISRVPEEGEGLWLVVIGDLVSRLQPGLFRGRRCHVRLGGRALESLEVAPEAGTDRRWQETIWLEAMAVEGRQQGLREWGEARRCRHLPGDRSVLQGLELHTEIGIARGSGVSAVCSRAPAGRATGEGVHPDQRAVTWARRPAGQETRAPPCPWPPTATRPWRRTHRATSDTVPHRAGVLAVTAATPSRIDVRQDGAHPRGGEVDCAEVEGALSIVELHGLEHPVPALAGVSVERRHELRLLGIEDDPRVLVAAALHAAAVIDEDIVRAQRLR